MWLCSANVNGRAPQARFGSTGLRANIAASLRGGSWRGTGDSRCQIKPICRCQPPAAKQRRQPGYIPCMYPCSPGRPGWTIMHAQISTVITSGSNSQEKPMGKTFLEMTADPWQVYLHQNIRHHSTLSPCLDAFKIPKFYKIPHHIEYLNVCMKY